MRRPAAARPHIPTSSRVRAGSVLALAVLTAGCTSGEPSSQAPVPEQAPEQGQEAASSSPGDSPTKSKTPGASSQPSRSPSEEPTQDGLPVEYAVSVPALAAQEHRGDRLRLGAVRERTDGYTSYDVSYRSRSTFPDGHTEAYRITGVLNVPTGRGPFPALVLAHGYIDPDIYDRGQGMTRERGLLAQRGYVALHVDYRNHAGSDDDPRFQRRLRLGYSADVINAVKALRRSEDVDVANRRIGLFGRSMGGGVILKALVAEPGLVGAAAPWASVSSLEAQNYNQFIRPDADDAGLRDELSRRFGLPGENPDFWRANSSRPYFDRITEPVLLVHGRLDDTCPPPWAAATQRALTRAGVDSRLEWYDDGHAFGPAFLAAMDRTVQFFDNQLGA